MINYNYKSFKEHQEYLTELMDKPYPYKAETFGNPRIKVYAEYVFKTENSTYYATFASQTPMSESDPVYILKQNVYEKYPKMNPEYTFVEFFFENMNTVDGTAITNTGDQFRVFATVSEILKRETPRLNADVLLFSAKEPSRKKLYDTFSKSIQRHFQVPMDTMIIKGVKYYIYYLKPVN